MPTFVLTGTSSMLCCSWCRIEGCHVTHSFDQHTCLCCHSIVCHRGYLVDALSYDASSLDVIIFVCTASVLEPVCQQCDMLSHNLFVCPSSVLCLWRGCGVCRPTHTPQMLSSLIVGDSRRCRVVPDYRD